MQPRWSIYSIFLLAVSLSTACEGQVESVTVTETPPQAVTATATPKPVKPAEATATTVVTARPTITLTLTPTGALPAYSEALLESLVWQEVEGVPGYSLKALKDWEMGFRSPGYCLLGPYRWLDGEHLLLFPIVELLPFQDEAFIEVAQPVVASLGGAAPWIVGEPQRSCQLPVWSPAAQVVIEVVAGEARLRDLEGRITASFPGRLPLELAPSGLRLVAGDSWIDIESGEVVPLPGLRADGHSKIGWTEDERRIFGCCFYYADVRSGERWEREEFPDFFIGGRGSWPGEELWSISHWIRDDTQAIVELFAFWFFPRQSDGLMPIPIPLFDPITRSYVDLISELNLGTPPNCDFYLAPGAEQLWLQCSERGESQWLPYEEAYLVTLDSLEVVAVTGQPEFLGWSLDGRYIVYNRNAESDESRKVSWLLTSDGESHQLADPAAAGVIWHPSAPLGALRYEEGNRLQFFNAASGQTREFFFEGPILETVWDPEEAGVILLTAEGRLWRLEDVFDASRAPEAITPAMSGLHSLRWSPDGGKVAFVGENVLFVATIAGK